MKRIIFTILLIVSAIHGIVAQTLTESIEFTGTAGNGTYAPFWHIANRQGVSCPENSMAYMRNNLSGKHSLRKDRIGLEWGVDIIAGYNLTSIAYVQQAYVDISWRMFRISVGQKERWSELGNHRLTTGSLVESGNARPIPQVRAEMPEYWDVIGTKGYFAIKGHLAYGIFTDGKWQRDFVSPYTDEKVYATGTRYHSKELLMRFGNAKKFPLTAEMGIHMVTQFGGTTYNGVYKTRKNPTRLKDYFLAFIPLKGDELYDNSDRANVAGNVLGSWLGAITWNDRDWMLRLYYDHAFNDHSQMFWEYGLWAEQLVGIELKLRDFKWIKGVTLEYFNLKNQSGPIYHDSTSEIPDQISCMDNNYNHSKYPGWFNYGQMIATPLCTSPIYNKDHILKCYNNRVEAFHAGIEGNLLTWLSYRMLVTHSNNWGSYNDPFKEIKQNTSGLVELTFKPMIPGGQWSITTSFAFDNGDLYGNNYGGMITIKRCGIYNISKERK